MAPKIFTTVIGFFKSSGRIIANGITGGARSLWYVLSEVFYELFVLNADNPRAVVQPTPLPSLQRTHRTVFPLYDETSSSSSLEVPPGSDEHVVAAEVHEVPRRFQEDSGSVHGLRSHEGSVRSVHDELRSHQGSLRSLHEELHSREGSRSASLHEGLHSHQGSQSRGLDRSSSASGGASHYSLRRREANTCLQRGGILGSVPEEPTGVVSPYNLRPRTGRQLEVSQGRGNADRSGSSRRRGSTVRRRVQASYIFQSPSLRHIEQERREQVQVPDPFIEFEEDDDHEHND